MNLLLYGIPLTSLVLVSHPQFLLFVKDSILLLHDESKHLCFHYFLSGFTHFFPYRLNIPEEYERVMRIGRHRKLCIAHCANMKASAHMIDICKSSTIVVSPPIITSATSCIQFSLGWRLNSSAGFVSELCHRI